MVPEELSVTAMQRDAHSAGHEQLVHAHDQQDSAQAFMRRYGEQRVGIECAKWKDLQREGNRCIVRCML